MPYRDSLFFARYPSKSRHFVVKRSGRVFYTSHEGIERRLPSAVVGGLRAGLGFFPRSPTVCRPEGFLLGSHGPSVVKPPDQGHSSDDVSEGSREQEETEVLGNGGISAEDAHRSLRGARYTTRQTA